MLFILLDVSHSQLFKLGSLAEGVVASVGPWKIPLKSPTYCSNILECELTLCGSVQLRTPPDTHQRSRHATAVSPASALTLTSDFSQRLDVFAG